jgi:hypothetical protein
MIKGSVPYVLCRIEDDASLTPVSQHGDFLTGIAAGGYAVEVEDCDFAYALYAGDPSNGAALKATSPFARRTVTGLQPKYGESSATRRNKGCLR